MKTKKKNKSARERETDIWVRETETAMYAGNGDVTLGVYVTTANNTL